MPPPKTLSKEKDDLLGKLCWHRAVSCAGATWPVVSVKGECSTCNWVTQSGSAREGCPSAMSGGVEGGSSLRSHNGCVGARCARDRRFSSSKLQLP